MVALALAVMSRASAAGTTTLRSPRWLLGCLALLVLGELLIAPLSLALMTKMTSRRYAGLMGCLFYALTAAGFLIAGEVGAALQRDSRGEAFAVLAGGFSWLPPSA